MSDVSGDGFGVRWYLNNVLGTITGIGKFSGNFSEISLGCIPGTEMAGKEYGIVNIFSSIWLSLYWWRVEDLKIEQWGDIMSLMRMCWVESG